MILKLEGEPIWLPDRMRRSLIPFEIHPLRKLVEDYYDHRRLRIFYLKGVQCVTCSAEGRYLVYSKTPPYAGDRTLVHVDVFTEDFILMTVDHYIPKSKGDTNDIDNLYPMCHNCNSKKGDELWTYDRSNQGCPPYVRDKNIWTPFNKQTNNHHGKDNRTGKVLSEGSTVRSTYRDRQQNHR